MVASLIQDTPPFIHSTIQWLSYHESTIIVTSPMPTKPSIPQTQQQTLILLILLHCLPAVLTLGLHAKYPPSILVGPEDTIGMSNDLVNILEGEARIDTSKDVDQKEKFVYVFQKLDPTTGLRVDILNEDGYEDPFLVDGILTGSSNWWNEKEDTRNATFANTH